MEELAVPKPTVCNDLLCRAQFYEVEYGFSLEASYMLRVTALIPNRWIIYSTKFTVTLRKLISLSL